MTHTLRVPYRNHIAAHQTPKPRCGNDRNHEARPGYDCRHAKYEWNSSLKQHELFEGCGEIDERPAWRCPCGRELQDVLQPCSCGSNEPAEYR